MPTKDCRSEELVAKLWEAEGLLGQDQKVPELVKALSITEVSCCHRWCNFKAPPEAESAA